MTEENVIPTPEMTLMTDTEDLLSVSSIVEKYTKLYAGLMELAKKQVEQALTPQEVFENAQLGFESFIQITKERIDFITDSINKNPNIWERQGKRYAYKYNGPLPLRGNPIVLEKANYYQDAWDDGIETLVFKNDGRDGYLSFTAELLDDGIRYLFRGVQLTPNPTVALHVSFTVEVEKTKGRGKDIFIEGHKKFLPNQRNTSGIISPFFEDSFRLYIKHPKDKSILANPQSEYTLVE